MNVPWVRERYGFPQGHVNYLLSVKPLHSPVGGISQLHNVSTVISKTYNAYLMDNLV